MISLLELVALLLELLVGPDLLALLAELGDALLDLLELALGALPGQNSNARTSAMQLSRS